MPIKVKSDMVFHFDYTFQIAATEVSFFFLRGNPESVIYVDYVSVYNPTANDFTNVYLLHRHKGVVDRCDYEAALNAGVVRKFTPDSYLTEDMEIGIAITGTAITDTIEVTLHGFRFKDEDYFKAT